MAEDKMMRLSQVARILNVGITTIVDHLSANAGGGGMRVIMK